MADLELRRNARGVFARLFTKAPQGLQIPDSRGGWYPLIREGFAGAWQRNIETPFCDVLSHPTVFACITLIAGDIAKMRWDLVQETDNDVWLPAPNNIPFWPVLRKPNHYQTPFQFRQNWMISKLEWGNTYALKQRDGRGIVTALHVLDPCRVRPLVAPDGSVFYELKVDALNQQPKEVVVVPAREIIHDHFNELFHPLVGISPLYAAGIPAMLGLKIETSSTHFFGNGSTPGGIVYVPGVLDQAKAEELKTRWETNFGGVNNGRVAILPDGMKFEPINVPNDKSQMNEQWLAASQAIAIAFHVPWYKVGGPYPPYNNVQAQNVEYLTMCLQPLIQAMETGLDEGLGLTPDRINGVQYGVQLKINDLLLMDTLTMMQTIREGVGAGVMAPNEGRAQLNFPPSTGGDTPYLQQQNFSLEALNRRDTAKPVATPPPQPPPGEPPADQIPADAMTASFTGMLLKSWEERAAA